MSYRKHVLTLFPSLVASVETDPSSRVLTKAEAATPVYCKRHIHCLDRSLLLISTSLGTQIWACVFPSHGRFHPAHCPSRRLPWSHTPTLLILLVHLEGLSRHYYICSYPFLVFHEHSS